MEDVIAKLVLQKVYREELELIAEAAEDSAAIARSNPVNKTHLISM